MANCAPAHRESPQSVGDSDDSTVLRVKDLTVEYHPPMEAPCRVLDGLELQLDAGESLGLQGPSGSGKTSLLLTLLGLLPSQAQVLSGQAWLSRPGDLGTQRLDLVDDGRLVPFRGSVFGWVPQEPDQALHPLLTVGDQVEEVLRAHRPWPRSRRRRHALELLTEVGLEASELARAYPHQLSGGQRQRVVVAQAIACRPPILLADEPTASLDPIARSALSKLLGRLRSRHRMALLWISHDEQFLARATERQLTLRKGRLQPSPPAPAAEVPGDPEGGL